MKKSLLRKVFKNALTILCICNRQQNIPDSGKFHWIEHGFTKINDEQKLKILRGTKSDENIKTKRWESAKTLLWKPNVSGTFWHFPTAFLALSDILSYGFTNAFKIHTANLFYESKLRKQICIKLTFFHLKKFSNQLNYFSKFVKIHFHSFVETVDQQLILAV